MLSMTRPRHGTSTRIRAVCSILNAGLNGSRPSRSRRPGHRLSAITKFKQICDHPDLYVGEGDYDEKSSGKFVQLRQICETIRDNGERVLVFTQYRELTGPLSDFLEKVFGRKGLVLHGGTSAKKRSEMVERFNSEDDYIPYMVLSLKAGGVGLNLTAANHVVHFDRWWNPAVENQATDRAFRIGQEGRHGVPSHLPGHDRGQDRRTHREEDSHGREDSG